jgi:hypothetical protein
VNGTDLSATNLAFFPMTAGVAGALFIAITIALTDRKNHSQNGAGIILRALLLIFPIMVILGDVLAFVTPSAATDWGGLRSLVSILLIASMLGLAWVLVISPVFFPRQSN